MKQHWSRLLLTLVPLVAVSFTSSASAGFVQSGEISKGDRVQVNWDGTNGNTYGGGEFKMRHNDGNGWNDLSIFTFCLEVEEHTQLGKDFIVGGISGVSIFGSGGADAGGVALTHQTRFLYNAYATGTLSTMTSFADTDAWADAFQRVVWTFQGQPDSQNWQSHSSASSLDQELITYANDNAVEGFDYGVFAMNLFTKSVTDESEFDDFDSTNADTWEDVYDFKAQDMLVYIPGDSNDPNPPPMQPVPEPSTVTVWLVAMLGLVAAARRRLYPAGIAG